MKTKELRNQLEKALVKLKESKEFPEDEPHMESAIQRFEYTFELAWKYMNSRLKDEGISTYGVKNVIREAAKLGLIREVDKWFEFALARNESAHIYREEIAKRVYKVASGDFTDYVEKLLSR